MISDICQTVGMPRTAARITCNEADRQILEARATSRTEAKQTVDRARMILGCAAGESVTAIAEQCQTRPNTVVAKEVKGSVHAVWRVLRKEGICLQRQRSWCVSTDKQFAAKAADIIALYLNPPEKALVISVDEKPSIQALERATGYVETDNGKIVRGCKSTYKRHGTLNLFAALQVATGAITTSKTTLKRRAEFLQFMDEIVAEAPPERDLHVILDNYCTHKKCEAWLAQHPNVHFHFTPTSASWLNQVEIWFGIMSRKALRGASFRSVAELSQAIDAFIAAYNPTAKPFKWRKREVKGAQLKNTIVNLRN
jgi:transposase